MALDGAFLHLLINELRCVTDTRIDKIYQPSRDELIFLLRKSGFHTRLFISVKSGRSRINLTGERPENPAQPPMFCMLLRKHLTGAKILDITQNGLERVAVIRFSATNELGDEVFPCLIAELISNQANLILIDGSGRIIDCLHRSDIESGKRLVQPGAVYTPPAMQNKLNPLDTKPEQLLDRIMSGGSYDLYRSILDSIDGISPLVARELAAYVSPDSGITAADMTDKEIAMLRHGIERIAGFINGGGVPVMLMKKGIPFDFSYMPVTQYGSLCTMHQEQDFSTLLDKFYSETDNADRLKHQAGELERLLRSTTARIARKMQLRIMDLKKCENREQLRIYGELIKVNMSRIKPGAGSITVENYYNDDIPLVTIPLNPALSAANNAAKYFKDYKKTYTAEQTLSRLIEQDKAELEYLESVSDSLARADSYADIADIKDELICGGYIRKPPRTQPKKAVPGSFKEYKSKEGYRILVGRNNRQNDLLTLKTAGKSDLWFHTKNIPGSHVVVLCDGGEVSDETVLYAANLAAINSKAQGGSNIAVDYTPVRYVHKPAGAKPGMVIYTTNRTVYVTP